MPSERGPKTHMCPVGACDAYGYEGDVCHQTYMHKGEPHGPMIPIPRSEAVSNIPAGLYTWEQILEAATKANERYGSWMPQLWVDYLNVALRELPSRPEPQSSGGA